ncbi:MAG: TIM barrel protein, partial [Anaerolineae bacterium]|nr:TIM barrel protein [Anaerolineae bacterium]
MRIAVVSDEISEDLAEALELGTLLEVDTYELRWVRPPGGLRHRRIGELSDDDAASLAATARRHRATVSALSPGLFHGRCDELTLGYELARLDRALHLARILGAQGVIVHGFRPADERGDGLCPPEVIQALTEAAGRAEAAGCVLLLRNAPDSYADSGAHTASIVQQVRSPALAVSWDPCHAVRAGETAIRDGYERVAPF